METAKYPIVLVHGLGVKNFPFLNSFGPLPRLLSSHGVRVYVPNHDGVGTVSRNAYQLKTEIEKICRKEGCQKVNIIAHSKGGLDARQMISVLGMAHRVASLTTLSTPHQGSGLSRTILRLPRLLLAPAAFLVNSFFRLFGDRNPDILTVARELTAERMAEFNARTPDHPQVYYQSYSSSLSKKNAFLTYIPYQISRRCEQDETDGLVSVGSSRWGTYQGHIAGNPHHIQMIALASSKKQRQAVAEFYLHIISQLAQMGF